MIYKNWPNNAMKKNVLKKLSFFSIYIYFIRGNKDGFVKVLANTRLKKRD